MVAARLTRDPSGNWDAHVPKTSRTTVLDQDRESGATTPVSDELSARTSGLSPEYRLQLVIMSCVERLAMPWHPSR